MLSMMWPDGGDEDVVVVVVDPSTRLDDESVYGVVNPRPPSSTSSTSTQSSLPPLPDSPTPTMSDIVNQLVRAAASIPTDISDTDLDRHVAELLAKEAKDKEVRWREMGIGALVGRTSGEGSRDGRYV